MRILAGLNVPGGDGVGLATDVHLPEELPAPAVVTRTPYDRAGLRAEGAGWAGLGFALVAQDVRGRYGSGGTWRPYRDERADGAALVDWVLDQPWCDGTVVASGASYGAFTAWTAALSRPDRVTAVVSQVPAMGTARVAYDRSGALRLAEHAGWWTEHAEARTSRTGLAAAMLRGEPGLLDSLPVSGIADRLWAPLPGWWPAVAGGPDHNGPEAVTDAELAGCPVPALHVGGWHDLFVPETLHQWQVAGRDVPRRPARALLVGPWAHELSQPGADRIGHRRYGAAARVRLGPLQAAWIREAAAGTARDWTKVFLAGADRWLTDWPARTAARVLHAGPDGSLTDRAPGEAGVHRFADDPRAPYPSVLPAHDRSALDERRDAVTFATDPLPAPLLLAGTARVRLHATSSAPGTDFVVRLVERGADGSAVEITAAAVDTAGRQPPYDLQLEATAVAVAAGSRLELVVTSSDFPRLARNLDTGADRHTTTRTAVAEQTIHTGPSYGTCVALPVLEDT